jgi:S1-C subfamily serine protease
VQYGAYVTSISSNSPASQAGIHTGDIVTSIGGVALDATHSFINTLFMYKPGDQVTVQFMRNGKSQQVQMTLGETTHG